jgi:uncharacterized protein (TIGR03000 family)
VTAFHPFTGQVQPIAFKPYVPPVACSGLVGRAYINCAIPDLRELAAASFYNTAFEAIYDHLYGEVRIAARIDLPVPEPRPVLDPARAYVTLEVPETAEVWVENEKLSQAGPSRQFVSPRLSEGRTYQYAVTVRWHDGKTMAERRLRVPVGAGDRPVVTVLAPLAKK